MSAEKTASVKLTLNSGSFLSGLKAITKAAGDTGRGLVRGLQAPTIAGLKRMGQAASEMGGALKNTLRMVGGLGGALSLAESVKGAVDLRAQWKQIAYDIKGGTGELVDFKELMKDAQTAAIQWGQSTEDLGRAFATVNEEVADTNFASDAMHAIAVTARGTGKSVEELADVAGKLNEKFLVGSSGIEDGLAKVVGMSLKGGVHFDQMAQAVEKVGSSAKLLGINGIEGFQKVIGMANLAKGSAKNLRGALTGVMGIMDEMSTPEGLKKMGAAFQIATKDAKGAQRPFFDMVESIMKKTHGKKSMLARGFQGEQLKIVNDLGQVFRETFEKTSGTVEQKTAAALDAYRAHLDEASRSQLDAAKVAQQAADRMNSPSAQMTVAMEKLKRAFTSPEMMDGLLKLAKMAPMAAQRLAGLAEMVFEHPAMAAGIFAGIKLGVPFLQGAIAAGGKSIATALLGAVMQGGGGASQVVGALGGGAAARGTAGAVGALGTVGLLAGAGLAGYQAGSYAADNWIDPVVSKSQGKTDNLQAATLAADMNTSGKFTKGGGEESLATLRASLDAAKKDKEFSWKDVATFGLRRLGTADSGDIDKGEKLYAERKKALDAMGPAAEKSADGLDKVTDALSKTADGLTRFARKLDGAGGSVPGSAPTDGPPPRGPLKLPPAAPGYRGNG